MLDRVIKIKLPEEICPHCKGRGYTDGGYVEGDCCCYDGLKKDPISKYGKVTATCPKCWGDVFERVISNGKLALVCQFCGETVYLEELTININGIEINCDNEGNKIILEHYKNGWNYRLIS